MEEPSTWERLGLSDEEILEVEVLIDRAGYYGFDIHNAIYHLLITAFMVPPRFFESDFCKKEDDGNGV